MKYQKLNKRAYTYIFSYVLFYAILINIFLIVGSVILNKYLLKEYSMIANLILIPMIMLVYACVFLIPEVVIRNHMYSVDDKKVEVISGIFFIHRRIVMLDKVYKIAVKKTIIGRILKVASITFTTAGGSVKLSYIDEKRAEKLVSDINKKILNNM